MCDDLLKDGFALEGFDISRCQTDDRLLCIAKIFSLAQGC